MLANRSDQDEVKIVVPKFPVIVSPNAQKLLDGRQLIDLQTKIKSLFSIDGRQFKDLPIKTRRILF